MDGCRPSPSCRRDRPCADRHDPGSAESPTPAQRARTVMTQCALGAPFGDRSKLTGGGRRRACGWSAFCSSHPAASGVSSGPSGPLGAYAVWTGRSARWGGRAPLRRGDHRGASERLRLPDHDSSGRLVGCGPPPLRGTFPRSTCPCVSPGRSARVADHRLPRLTTTGDDEPVRAGSSVRTCGRRRLRNRPRAPCLHPP